MKHKKQEFYGGEANVDNYNCAKFSKELKFKNLSKKITLSGMDSEHPLRKLGDINLWVDSKAYNHIENIHLYWLLIIVDLIIGNTEYTA